jgi:cbb3-type cytochrome oxidase subunit 1
LLNLRASERMPQIIFEWWYGHSSASFVLRDFGEIKL